MFSILLVILRMRAWLARKLVLKRGLLQIITCGHVWVQRALRTSFCSTFVFSFLVPKKKNKSE